MIASPVIPSIHHTTVADARAELGRFFAIAAVADRAPGMFSEYIDAEWHRLLESDEYAAFCKEAAGRHIDHVAGAESGQITWLKLYHERFGLLPDAWFADRNGVVDVTARAVYLSTRTVRASWNCSATTGDPDHSDADADAGTGK